MPPAGRHRVGDGFCPTLTPQCLWLQGWKQSSKCLCPDPTSAVTFQEERSHRAGPGYPLPWVGGGDK